MALLGIDIGTTHCKAGLFHPDGTVVRVAVRPTITHRNEAGIAYYEPDELWSTVASAIREALSLQDGGQRPPQSTECTGTSDDPGVTNDRVDRIAGIGIASMAESGLLIERATGRPASPFLPWFERCSTPQAERMAKADDPVRRFAKAGLHANFKQGLAKLLWLRDQGAAGWDGAVWLSAADYIAFRLTGSMATDYTLAARTFAYDIASKRWDEDWIREFGLSPDMFPDVFPSGSPVGTTAGEGASRSGLPAGIPVTVAGHDHVVAALAVGAVEAGDVYDSMGTAETLVGAIESRPLGEAEHRSGLTYGVHVVPGHLFWMGGNSASGGSVEWLLGTLSDPPLTYKEMFRVLDSRGADPTGIFYYPYLSGSGAPMPDTKAKAAVIGLTKSHTRADLLWAVLEGTAYQMEAIRRAAEQVAGYPIRSLKAVGGGTKNSHWLQIKADVSGCHVLPTDLPEATLLGAALLGGVAGGIYTDAKAAAKAAEGSARFRSIEPVPARHEIYTSLFEQGYMPLQPHLRTLYHAF